MRTTAIDPTFGRNLKRFRDRAKLTQRELAKRAGVSNVYICYIEHGRCDPSLPMCRKLAECLGVPLDVLFVTFPEKRT